MRAVRNTADTVKNSPPCIIHHLASTFLKPLMRNRPLQEEQGLDYSIKYTSAYYFWLPILPATMVLRVNIDQIEPATRDWICKVQIVDIARPRESLDKKCTFQNLILEDEEECQIKAVMYADEIQQYANTLKLLNTYLISTARVKVSPTSYGKPIHKFHWILDKETVIEQIKPSNEVEKPLPPPTKLPITSFDHIPHLMVDSAAEIDILAIVLRCGPQKNAGRSHHRCREITLCDNQNNHFLLTLWEDFGEIEGHEIASKMATEADLPVILGRSIGISTYQGLSLQTRYNSTLRVNPNYPQAVALINWAKENRTTLLSCPSEKTSTSSSISPMIVSPAGQQFLSIAKIPSAPSMNSKTFVCLNARAANKKEAPERIERISMSKMQSKTSLVPRYYTFEFLITLSTKSSLSYTHISNFPSFHRSFQIDLIDHICYNYKDLSLLIRGKITAPCHSNTTHATLSILSYMEKEHTPQSTTDRTSKKIKPLEICEELPHTVLSLLLIIGTT
ncbi:hypothetical protein H5410_006528 [Solanum commersonii]|uniref:Replication protein A OB domain-containing protein n=1 Tax=Solanum commersonii TaxID=4109 RepID=A0A9J6A9E2_SOLCO|nr:hypothetical protein H5410_006528 [Solanum commersonii]